MKKFLLLIGALGALINSGFGGAVQGETAELPTLKREDVQAFLQKVEPVWSAKIPKGQSRIFYFENEWTAETDRIRNLSGKGAEYRKLLFDAADRIVTTPIPEYRTPEEMVSPTHSYLSAKEEGWQRGFGNQIVGLALAAKIDPQQKYLSKLHDMVLAACKYPTWGRHGKNGELVDMDLAAGHIVRGISIAYDVHRGLFSEEEKAFIRAAVQERVHRLLEGLYGGIFWSNWYSQNHNHICVAALGLAGLGFYEEIPEAPEWLAGAFLNFQNVGRALASDGSSYEGLPYWGYGRSFVLQFIEGTKKVTGADAIYEAPAFRNALAYRLGCSTPGLNGVLMWSDSRGFDGTGPQHILYRLASQYHDGEGQYLADHLPFVPQGGADIVASTLLWYDPSIQPQTPTALDYHASDWDVVTTRSGWGDGDYMLSLKSGLNCNHHTQLDAGSLSLNLGGEWLLLTPGYGLGLGKEGFFDQSKKRWEFLSSATESHATLLINGQNQRFDQNARATIDRYISSPSWLWTEVDLKEVYHNTQSVRRRVVHARGDYILVVDEAAGEQPMTVEWLAQVPPDTTNSGRSLLAKGVYGNLSIQVLGHAANFERRLPTSKVQDVSSARLATFSSKNAGTDVRLATLLQPTRGGASADPIRTNTEDLQNGRYITLKTSQWCDDLWIMATPCEITAKASSGQKSVATAEAMVIRHRKDEQVGMVAVKATRIEFGALSFQSALPFDLAIEKAGKDRWELSLGSAFEGTVALPSGIHFFTETGGSLDGEVAGATAPAKLKSGRYFLVKTSQAALGVGRELASRFPPREAVSPWSVQGASSLAPAPADARIYQECEDSPVQNRGNSTVEQRPGASGGSAIMGFGTESLSHSIGWKVHVIKPGVYYLKLRYGISQPQTAFTLLVDGTMPGIAAKHISLAGPKGWGTERTWTVQNSGWMEAVLADASGVPLKIPLLEGSHEIRFAAPSNGMNLDSFELIGAGSLATP